MFHIFTYINLLNPTGHVMHHQFNIQQLYALPTVFMCFAFIIIIFINCKWVDTRWQWLFYVYTKCDIDYY
jgi:hypothetical protein